MRNFFLVTVMLFTFVPLAGAQQDFDDVEIRVQRVGSNVYMLQGAGGNIGVAVGKDGVLLIDDQYAPLAPKIEVAIGGFTDKKLTWVLNTHWHGDHTGGNEYFGKSAPLVAHHNVRKRLMKGSEALGSEPAPPGALPVLTFGSDLEMWLDEDQSIRAIHVPHAHTDGDAVVWFPQANVVHMGDLFFAERFPFIDHASGGSVAGLIEGVHRIIATIPPDTTIIPGHGPVSTVEDLRKYAAMLRETFTIVQRGVATGMTLEEMKEANVLEDYEDLAWRFITAERFLENLDREARKAID